MNCRCPSGTVRANNTTSRQGTVHQIQVCQVVWAGSMHHDEGDGEGDGVDDDHGDNDDSDDHNHGDTGNFCQVVWASSRLLGVGCARSPKTGKVLFPSSIYLFSFQNRT